MLLVLVSTLTASQDIALKLKDKANKQLMATYQHLQRTMDCIEQTVVLLDTSVTGWRVVYVNGAWTKHTGEPLCCLPVTHWVCKLGVHGCKVPRLTPPASPLPYAAGVTREQLNGMSLSDALEGTDGSQLPTTDMQIAAGKLRSCDIRRARLKGPLCPAGSASTFTLNFR